MREGEEGTSLLEREREGETNMKTTMINVGMCIVCMTPLFFLSSVLCFSEEKRMFL